MSAGTGAMEGIVFPWELWNRGKKAIALDLRVPAAREIVLRLCATADVFLTSYLPATREKLGIGLDAVRERNPSIIYACGSGQGPRGPEADKGGYDSISFWHRGGVSASVTPPGHPAPLGMPSGAFGDSTSGIALAGGIAAALVKKARTGQGSIVDGSLLGSAAWCMQMASVEAAVRAAASPEAPGAEANPPAPPAQAASSASASRAAPSVNPFVNTYRTVDGRWVALCMLQPDVYFDGLVRAVGRADLAHDPRFDTPRARAAHPRDLADELAKRFAALTFDEARAALASQRGQWDVVNRALDVLADPQARALGMVQDVDYGGGRALPMVTTPVHFDRTPPTLTPAPGFAVDTEDVLRGAGLDEQAIADAKSAGAVL
jgi:crotonobetainyl-CoA:carnitine CoA-transferase CaiB-like acyl-CoA transferase